MEYLAWDFRWNIPTDALITYVLATPWFVVARGSFLTPNGTTCACERQPDAVALPQSVFQPVCAVPRSPMEANEAKANIGPRCVLLDGWGQLLRSWESFPWKLLKAYARSEQPTWQRINPVRKLTSKRTSLLWHWQSHDKTATIAKGPHTRVHSKASGSKKLNVCVRAVKRKLNLPFQ